MLPYSPLLEESMPLKDALDLRDFDHVQCKAHVSFLIASFAFVVK